MSQNLEEGNWKIKQKNRHSWKGGHSTYFLQIKWLTKPIDSVKACRTLQATKVSKPFWLSPSPHHTAPWWMKQEGNRVSILFSLLFPYLPCFLIWKKKNNTNMHCSQNIKSQNLKYKVNTVVQTSKENLQIRGLPWSDGGTELLLQICKIK